MSKKKSPPVVYDPLTEAQLTHAKKVWPRKKNYRSHVIMNDYTYLTKDEIIKLIEDSINTVPKEMREFVKFSVDHEYDDYSSRGWLKMSYGEDEDEDVYLKRLTQNFYEMKQSEAKRKKSQEEKDRQEYERLKKKFEK